MTLLVTRDALLGRRTVAHGALAALTKGLRSEIDPLVRAPHLVPTEKALLSRDGGRCPCDGAYLPYEPFDARHRCPRCRKEATGERHDRFRLYWHQLWLAERTVHAALLGVLLDDASCRTTATDLLDAYAAQYLHYPNADNVLGPSRPFFSTYLESIWLLQLCVAIDLLELGAPSDTVHAVGGRLRDRVIAPSVALIESYDEGMSNRQVWNNAALFAAGSLLGSEAMTERALHAPSGLVAHLGEALLADGSWYEGENYHLFAHRGLWYGVAMAERAGHELPPELVTRFDTGFVAPLRTVLPDLTYPSRRDSQYAVSVRQLRVAESCELGVARRLDERLLGWLARLYDPAVRRGETGRASTSADVERQVPATGLVRTDLSWRTLLLAREHLPALKAQPLESDLLPSQGFGVLRREGGAVYVALDYGHAGGGHGHADRLNLLMVDGQRRWFDDPGTGSYVDETLPWYRSTLAHTAPVIDGRSQPRVEGALIGFADDGRAGWLSATATLAPGLVVRRSVIVMEQYLIDEIDWTGDETHDVALPLHGVDLVDDEGHPVAREPASLADPLHARDDGVSYLADVARCTPPSAMGRLRSVPRPGDAKPLSGWLLTGRGTTWWSASAPRAPGLPGREPMLLVRRRATTGRIAGVWSWRDAVASVERVSDTMVVTLRAGDRHVHRRTDLGWRIETADRLGSRRSVDLASHRAALTDVSEPLEDPALDAGLEEASSPPLTLPHASALGEVHYRRSEDSWTEAGEPAAEISITRNASNLVVDVRVERSHRLFVEEGATNPYDNEPAVINGDGVQVYVSTGALSGGWVLVPAAGRDEVAVHPVDGWPGELRPVARWHSIPNGYAMHVEVALDPDASTVGLDVLVNEIAPGRARRRGQLVLSGAAGEFVYLRGDRHERDRLLHFSLADV